MFKGKFGVNVYIFMYIYYGYVLFYFNMKFMYYKIVSRVLFNWFYICKFLFFEIMVMLFRISVFKIGYGLNLIMFSFRIDINFV